MSWIFHEPPDPAMFGRRRAFAPPTARRANARARSIHAFDVWLDEPWPPLRRARAPAAVVHARAPPLGPARRLLAVLLASGVYESLPTWQSPRRHRSGPVQAGDDVGRSASLTVTFTGKGDDPFGGVGMAAGPGVALGVDTGRELAVQNLSVFDGSSASRAV